MESRLEIGQYARRLDRVPVTWIGGGIRLGHRSGTVTPSEIRTFAGAQLSVLKDYFTKAGFCHHSHSKNVKQAISDVFYAN